MTTPLQIHEVPASAVFTLLRGRPDGLNPAEVESRRREIGPNRLRPPSRWRWARLLAKHAFNFFSLLLDLAAGVCFVADAIQPGEGMGLLGWALLGVSVLNVLFAFAQEIRAEQAMEALKRFLPQQVRVRRAGVECQVLAEELVPGDVLLVGEGDRIAADARLVESEDLLVNNAPLTGESRSQALRTTAAKGRLIESPNILFAGCGVLRGLIALDDPIRPEAPPAVSRCQGAGIQVVLITGDHRDTAEAVARACGILRPDESAERRILHGEELERLREHQLVERLREGVAVFARTTPEQKMKIVLALKRLGLVVAMTGDGVNDSPALKAADVGIAMGASGTDVAREAADIVLLDDNFASITAGVEEGRAVFANMRRFTTYVLASNVPEIVPFLLYILLPVPLALTVIQILSIDLGTDLLPAIGLGREPPERDLMHQPPRRRDERLLSWPLMRTAYLFLGLIQAAFSLALFFLVLDLGGWTWGQELAETAPLYQSATGLTLAAIMLMQVGNVIARRSEHGSGLDRGLFANRLILLGIAVEILLSWAVLYAEPVRAVLNTGPVEPWIYGLAWLGPALIIGLDGLRKSVAGRFAPPY